MTTPNSSGINWKKIGLIVLIIIIGICILWFLYKRKNKDKDKDNDKDINAPLLDGLESTYNTPVLQTKVNQSSKYNRSNTPVLQRKVNQSSKYNRSNSPVLQRKTNTSPVYNTPVLQRKVNPSPCSSDDNRSFKPKYNYTDKNRNKSNYFEGVTKKGVSPDVMSQASNKSSVQSVVGDNSLLQRLKKFAR